VLLCGLSWVVMGWVGVNGLRSVGGVSWGVGCNASLCVVRRSEHVLSLRVACLPQLSIYIQHPKGVDWDAAFYLAADRSLGSQCSCPLH
jgi:hypothetical protein